MKKIFKSLIPFLTALIIVVSGLPVWAQTMQGTPPVGATGAAGPSGPSYDGTTVSSITSSTGTLTLGGAGGTNNERIQLNFESLANQLFMSSNTGVGEISTNGIGLDIDTTRAAVPDGVEVTYVIEDGDATSQQSGLRVNTTIQETGDGSAVSVYGIHVGTTRLDAAGTVGHLIGMKIGQLSSTGGGTINGAWTLYLGSPGGVSSNAAALHIEGLCDSGISMAGTASGAGINTRICSPAPNKLDLQSDSIQLYDEGDSRTSIGNGLTIWSSNDANPTDNIRIYQDQTNAVFELGEGSLAVNANISVDGGTGSFGLIADGSTGGSLMLRDTDDAGWTECFALNGTLSCTIDADGVPDGS